MNIIKATAILGTLFASAAVANASFTVYSNVVPDFGTAFGAADEAAFVAATGATLLNFEDFEDEAGNAAFVSPVAGTGSTSVTPSGGVGDFFTVTTTSTIQGLFITDDDVSEAQPFPDPNEIYLFDQNQNASPTTFTFDKGYEGVSLWFRDPVDLSDVDNNLKVLVNGTHLITYTGQKLTGTKVFLGIAGSEANPITSLTFSDDFLRDGIGYDNISVYAIPEPSTIVGLIALGFVAMTQVRRVVRRRK